MRVNNEVAGEEPGTSTSTGVRYMVLGAFFFSLMSLFVKLVGNRMPSQEIVLARGVLTLLITYFLLRHAGIPPWGRRKGLLVLRGVLGFAALSGFYYALVHLPLADATVIQYTNPVWTALLAAWFLGERLRRKEVALVLMSLLGVLLVTRPPLLFGEAAGRLAALPVGVALAGAILSAGAYVTVRTLGRTEHPLVIVFYFTLVTVPAALPALAMGAVWPTPREWLMLLGVGITAQLGQVYLTRGLQQEAAGRAMAISYLQVVFAAVWGALVFSEFPDAWAIAGALIILASTLGLARRKRSRVPRPVATTPKPALE